MTRLVFPDDRLVFGPSVNGASLRSRAGTTVTVYTDAAGTTLADLLTSPGGVAITGSVLTVDTNSMLPLFQGPNDGTDTLYAKPAGSSTLTPIYARVDDRIDTINSTMLTQTSASGTYLPFATKTQADPGQAGDTNVVTTGMNRSTAGGADAVIRGEAQAASLFLANNTGTDLTVSTAFAAVQFQPGNVTTFGAVKVRLKKSAGLLNTATITANVYTDNAGKPGTLLSINNGSTTVYAINLSSSAYTVKEFLLRLNGASPNVPYWVVFSTAGVSGGNFILDSAASGGTYATSPDGTTWTNTASAPYIECRGQNVAGSQGTSETYVGKRGDSSAYYGVYGNSDTGIGVHGGSSDGYGVEGISVGNDGVHGVTQGAAYGVYGSSTNGVGTYGTGGQGGVRGDSSNGFGGVLGTNSASNGPGVWGDNTSTGPGIYGRSVPGTGYGIQSEGFFAVTSGFPPAGAAGAAAGTSPPAPVLPWPGCQNSKGKLTFGTGSAPSAGVQVAVTFGKTAPTTGTVVICPGNAATAALQPYVTGESATGFSIATAVAPAASQANTVYSIAYHVIY